MVTATAVIFRIGSRGKQTLVELVSEAFLGWLVTDGYVAYRDRERRQRCLAHYADLRIMPTEAWEPAPAAAIAAAGVGIIRAPRGRRSTGQVGCNGLA